MLRIILLSLLFFFPAIHADIATLNYADIQQQHPLDQPWHVTHDTVLDGNSGQLVLAAPITIAAFVTLTLRNCVLTNVSNKTLQLLNNSSTLVLDNCVLLLASDYHFSCGRIYVRGVSELRGAVTWHHTSNRGVFIEKDSTLLCSQTCLYYYHPTNDMQRGIKLANQYATLMLHNAHLRAGSGGLLLTRGTLCIHESCTAHADNRDPAYGILLGTGKRAKDNVRFVFATPRSRLHISQRHLCENNCTRSTFWQVLAWCTAAGIGIGLSTL